MPNVLIFCLVKVAMLGQFKKDYVALNLPSVGADANGNRGWPKRSLWRVRNVILKCSFTKGCTFLPRLLASCLHQQVGVASVSRASQVFAFITDRMKPERIV